MPEMDGVQLAVETLKMRTSRPFPLVLLSSWDLDDPRIKENQHLFASIVMKPLKISSLQSLLRNVLGTQGSAPPIATASKKSGRKLATEIPLSIVVAEDNSINQKLIQRMLRGMGYEPVIVDTGLGALNSVERGPCDLIFMDVQMPEMDGLEATQKIRQRHGEKPTIIAMTAFALSGDKEKCLRAGMNDYLSKPFVSDQVESMIRKWGTVRREPDVPSDPSRNDAAEPFDADLLARIKELEDETAPSFVRELIGLFLDEASSSLPRLRDAYRTLDRSALVQVAHKLRGSSLNLGAGKLSGLLAQAESIAKDDVSIVPDSLMESIEIESERIISYLRKRTSRD